MGKQATKTLDGLLWNENSTKKRLFHSIFGNIVLNGAETWSLTKTTRDTIRIVELDHMLESNKER